MVKDSKVKEGSETNLPIDNNDSESSEDSAAPRRQYRLVELYMRLTDRWHHLLPRYKLTLTNLQI